MGDDDKIFAFVLMPFNEAFNDVYKLGIKETASQLGITAERVDEQIFREGILERIYRQIDLADLILADMSGQIRTSSMRLGMHMQKGSSAY